MPDITTMYDLGHKFQKVGEFRGIDVFICVSCGSTCKRGDTVYNTCQRSWD